MINLLCDEDGVPILIQRLRYIYTGMWFEATFFNGETMLFCSDQVCRSVGLMGRPDRMQMLEAENNINKLAELNWGKWFPHLTLVA